MTKSNRSSRNSDTSLDRWGLRISLALALATAFLLMRPSSCQGQDRELPDVSSPCAPELSENRRAVLDHEGDSGIWFHLEVARCMLGRLKALPLYAQRVSLLEQRLQISDERTTLLRQHIELAEQGEKRAVGALDESERLRREAEEKLDAWFRHPVFLMGTGAVLVIAIEVVAIVVFEKVSD